MHGISNNLVYYYDSIPCCPSVTAATCARRSGMLWISWPVDFPAQSHP